MSVDHEFAERLRGHLHRATDDLLPVTDPLLSIQQEAGRRRWTVGPVWGAIRGVSVALAVAIPILVIVVIALSAGSSRDVSRRADQPSSSPGHDRPPAHAAVVTPDSNLSRAVIDLLVPTNGESFDAGAVAFGNFKAAIRANVTDRCLAADGLPAAPEGDPVGESGFDLLPDLHTLRLRGKFDVIATAPPDPTAGMSSSERAAYRKALARCQHHTPRFNAPYVPGAGRLATDWASVLDSIVASSPVRRANRTAAACSRTTRFPGDNYIDEITVMANAESAYYYSRHLTRLGQIAKGNAINHQAAEVYLRCFGPAIRVVQQLAAARRGSFLAKHALALREVQRATARAVSTIEVRYGVRFGG